MNIRGLFKHYSSHAERTRLEREARLCRYLKHKNIGGELFEEITSRQKYTEEDARY
ncbi:hypothetical protein MXB_3456 [Myxobolus squamalis]|nr:hypothetical protein MXB_3456 [Myxobolus squamalis]